MKKFFKIFIALLAFAAGVGMLFFYDFYLVDKVNTTQVLAVSDDVGFKDKITKENLVVLTIRKDNAVKEAFKPEDESLVLEQYAAIDIKKGTQLYPSLIDSHDLIPNEEEGEFIAPITNEWLFAVPGSLRRTFIADFYAIPDKDQALIRSLVEEGNNHEDELDKPTEKEEPKDAEDNDSQKEEPIDTNKKIDSAITDQNKPILENVRVASVKDGSNSEVTESSESQNSATGTISNLEIIANQDMLNTLREYTDTGYKIYVVYKFER